MNKMKRREFLLGTAAVGTATQIPISASAELVDHPAIAEMIKNGWNFEVPPVRLNYELHMIELFIPDMEPAIWCSTLKGVGPLPHTIPPYAWGPIFYGVEDKGYWFNFENSAWYDPKENKYRYWFDPQNGHLKLYEQIPEGAKTCSSKSTYRIS